MMLRRAVLLVALGVFLAPACASPQVAQEEHTEIIRAKKPAGPSKDSADPKAVADLIVRKTNAFRKEHGRASVQVNARLARTAQLFAEYMARTSRYGHHADGYSPAQRVRAQGYTFCIVAENIAYAYTSAGFGTTELGENFFQGWKHSPPHRKNMLDPDVTETGVAVARSEKTGYWFAVQLFGRPLSASISFQIENETEATIQYKLAERTFSLPPHCIRTHEVGRPPTLTFAWPKGGGEPASIRPTADTHFVITQDDSRFHVKKR